jgi:Transposase DDE domain
MSSVTTVITALAMSYRTVKRRLPGYAKPEWRNRLSGACAAAAQLGPSALVLYDVTTLRFETDTGDGFREPGFSKERRLDPQITVGLLTDATGMPLIIDAFEGNRAETKTIIPLVQRFVAAHGIAGVTVIADAGMMSEANLAEVEDAGWSFVIGGKLPEVPYVINQWRQANPDAEPADGMTLTQPVIMGPKPDQRRRRTLYQYKSDRARRSVHGIEQQVAKAEKAVAGQAAIKRNRFVTLSGGTRTVNRELETKARTVAGWKPYVTNIVDADPAWVIGAYHQLVAHRARLPDVQTRPTRPAGLPPQTRIHQRPPRRRLRRAGNLPPHRSPDRLDDQEIRPRPPPLPDRQDQHRQPHPPIQTREYPASGQAAAASGADSTLSQRPVFRRLGR